MSYRSGKIGVSAFFSGNAQLNSTTINNYRRTSTDPVTNNQTLLLQNGGGAFSRNGYQSGIGLDYSLSKYDNFNASIGYSGLSNKSGGIIDQQNIVTDINNNPLSNQFNYRNATSNIHNNTIDLSLTYRKTFKQPKKELDITYISSFGKNNTYFNQSQTLANASIPYSGSQNNNPGKFNETDISVDYSQPISKAISMETGAKGIFQRINTANNNFILHSDRSYTPDINQNFDFSYNRNIYAYYLSFSYPIGKWLLVKSGARYEYTDNLHSYSKGSLINIPSYGTFVPAVVLSHKINETESVKLNYTYRISRPGYLELNPFINYSDPHNITSGNPLLRPATIHKVELSYNKDFANGASLNITSFFQRNAADIKSIINYYPSLIVADSTFTAVSFSQLQNIGYERKIGGIMIGSYPVLPTLNLRSSLQVYDRKLVPPPYKTTENIEYRITGTATWKISSSLVFEGFGNYNSPTYTVQGKNPSFTSYNFAIRKQLLNKNLSLGLSGTNIFNKYVNQVSTTSGYNFVTSSQRFVPYRSFGLNLLYHFGKLDFKKNKDDANDYLNTPPQ